MSAAKLQFKIYLTVMAFIILWLTAFSCVAAFAEQIAQDTDCAERRSADGFAPILEQSWTDLEPDGKHDSRELYAPWGLPQFALNDPVIALINRRFLLGYHSKWRVPVWASYWLNETSQTRKLTCPSFVVDPRLQCLKPVDFEDAIIEMGQLVPSADVFDSDLALVESCFKSNAIPLDPSARVVLQRLESEARRLAKKGLGIFVTCGAIFDHDEDGLPDERDIIPTLGVSSRVGIPSHYFKILLRKNKHGAIESMAACIPNSKSSAATSNASRLALFQKHITSIDKIEAMSGADYFPEMSRRLQDRLESAVGRAW